MDKIAFFIPSFYGGGAQKVIVNLANGMCKKNYQVDLLVVNNNGCLLHPTCRHNTSGCLHTLFC